MPAPDIFRNCWFLAGPTACGKSQVGLAMADRLGGEIVSLDSMAIYRGMDIGTAKPSDEDRQKMPHHLIDVVDPHDEYSVADYVQTAENICREILARGRTPIFVGGTGLYLRSILRGVFEGPPADWEYRRELEIEAEQTSPESIHRKLRAVDPDIADALHPNDIRRVIRALEVYHVTRRPLSEQQKQLPLPVDQRPRHVYWLLPPREWLYERINHRVDQMITDGLVDEVRRLLALPHPLSRTAGQALGYKEIIEFFEGQYSRERAIELIKTRTRQFAKRQHTWFRHLEECTPVEISGSETIGEIADRLVAISET